MPGLNTQLHTKMLADWKSRHSSQDVYGTQWGDVEKVEPLRYVRDHYVKPFVRHTDTAVEIGPGGGRWTRYLCEFGKLYAVDYYAELLAELKLNFGNHENIIFIKNNGTDFPSIPLGAVNYVFSFGTFVHLDFPLSDAYLHNIKRIVVPDANVVIQYSDKTKILARNNPTFRPTICKLTGEDMKWSI